MKTIWTDATQKTLCELYPTTNTHEVARIMKRAYRSITSKAHELSLCKAADYVTTRKNSFWNKENEQYLVDNFSTKSHAEMAALLKTTVGAVQNRCYKLGIKRPSNFGRFRKGSVPANKGKKQTEYMSAEAVERSKAFRFKKGNVPHNTLKDFEITRRCDSAGRPYLFIRISLAKWELYHRHIWMQKYGSIPPAHIIIFKDKNSLNCTIENLEMISMAENALRNRGNDLPLELRSTIKMLNKLNKSISNYEKQNR